MSSNKPNHQHLQNNESRPPRAKLRSGPLICCLFGVSFTFAGIRSEPNQVLLSEDFAPTSFVRQDDVAIQPTADFELEERSRDLHEPLFAPPQIATPDTPKSASAETLNSSELGWESSHPMGPTGSFTLQIHRSKADRL